MKIPFDIEKAKAGYQVVTRRGNLVEILKYDLKSNLPIAGIVERCGSELIRQWTSKGSFYPDGMSMDVHDTDLFLLEPKAAYSLNDVYVSKMDIGGKFETTVCRATTKEYADLILKALQFYEDNKPQSE